MSAINWNVTKCQLSNYILDTHLQIFNCKTVLILWRLARRREVDMANIGYLYLAREKHLRIPLAEQQQTISACGSSLGKTVEEFFVEQGAGLRQALAKRQEGKRIIAGLQAGDAIFVARAAFVLGSSRDAAHLLQSLREEAVSLFCVDLGEDISLDGERKLVVSQGGAMLVQNFLAALNTCDRCSPSEAIQAAKKTQKRQGKYLGGPVPFGWQRGSGGFLVQHPGQQLIIYEMLKFREDRWSYRDIARKVLERHKLGLSHEGIRRILELNHKKKEEEQKRLAAVSQP